jgi:hypothetical protein
VALSYNTWFISVFNNIAAVSTSTPIGPTGVVSSYTDPNWLLELPNMIDYGEQRLFRDLDLLNWRVTDASGMLVGNQRTFALPTSLGVFRRLEHINIITLSSDASPAQMRNPLTPTSRAMLDFSWPSNSTYNGVPEVFAMRDDQTVILGPPPDQNYAVECIGPQTPLSLSLTNQTTFLSTMLPDLFFTATMVKAAAYMRDFGSMSENPQMSVNWEGQYQALLKSADVEEAARWYRSAGWTAQVPKAVSTPPRV